MTIERDPETPATSSNNKLPDHNPELDPIVSATVVQDKLPETFATSTPVHIAPNAVSTMTSFPPPNCPDGGQWGTISYIGEKTKTWACLGCLCCGLPALFVLLCPQDEKDAYRVNGKVYDAAGEYLGPSSKFSEFVPTRHYK
jgi:hypothetical protein